MRLDRFLVQQLADMSRSAIQRWIDADLVTVDGKIAPAKRLLKIGECVECRAPKPTPAPRAPHPEILPLDILYEDDAIIVVNKAAGMSVHPGAGRNSGTLVNALLARFGALSSPGDGARPGIVHRLDIGTSGVIVIARTDRVHLALQKQFAERTTRKKYFALCYGALAARGVIATPIGRHPAQRTKMAVRTSGGRAAWTGFTRVVAFGKHAASLAIDLRTGRTHQIRVHLASIHHPLLGDATYAGANAITRLPAAMQPIVATLTRPALHAWELELTHPVSGARMQWIAPLPDDLQTICKELGAWS